MTIVIEDIELEQLIEKIASVDGVSVTKVLRDSLDALVKLRGVIDHKEALRERLAQLTREMDAISARTPPDPRSDNEILGYNEYGVWN
jgi:hypothetical protein